MYTFIPMPRIEWDKDSMKYVFIFFPWIGLLIGGVSYGWYVFSATHGLNDVFTAVILVLIPIVLTGGIHMDGFIDTCDAIFSYGDKDKKLEILKDPRTGAFGAIGCGICLLLILGIDSQLLQCQKYIILMCLLYFISRCVGAIALLTVRNAKPDGLGTTFANAAENKLNIAVLAFYLAVAFVLTCLISMNLAVIIFIVLVLYLFLYISYIKKNFGGITGDLTGFLITSVEIILLFIMAIGGCL